LVYSCSCIPLLSVFNIHNNITFLFIYSKRCWFIINISTTNYLIYFIYNSASQFFKVVFWLLIFSVIPLTLLIKYNLKKLKLYLLQRAIPRRAHIMISFIILGNCDVGKNTKLPFYTKICFDCFFIYEVFDLFKVFF
jgi:hypothetical protein